MLGNLEEYRNPDLYDAENDSFQDDFTVFVGLKTHGSALDLACGTGRLTIALAESGLACIGLDTSHPMLARAKKKSEGLEISYQQGDIRHFQLSQKFDLITLAGNAFQALLSNEDQEKLLLCVRAHLNSSGIFAFNTRNAGPDTIRTIKDYEFWHDFIDPKGQLVKVYGRQSYHSSKDIVCYTTKRIWPDAEMVTNIELRFTSAEVLAQKLQSLGFKIMNQYGDFQKNSYIDTSQNIIFVCEIS